jgi:hypothetical protein
VSAWAQQILEGGLTATDVDQRTAQEILSGQVDLNPTRSGLETVQRLGGDAPDVRRQPEPWDFDTTLKMTSGMRSKERGVVTEVRGNRHTAARYGGSAEEHDAYVDRGGADTVLGSETLGAIDQSMSANLLEGTFDLLSIGNYAASGFTDELILTGSVWEGFKQMGLELGNALPFFDFTEEGARAMGFGETALFSADFFTNSERTGHYIAPVLGLALDIIADPINLIPGAFFAKGIVKAASAGSKAARKVGAVENIVTSPLAADLVRNLRRKFVYEADILDGTGAAGAEFVGMQDEWARRGERVNAAVSSSLMDMFARFTPGERAVLGMTAEHPKTMEPFIRDMVDRGSMAADKAEEILGFVGEEGIWTNHVRRLYRSTQTRLTKDGKNLRIGMLDHPQGEEFFINGPKMGSAAPTGTGKYRNKIIDERPTTVSALKEQSDLLGIPQRDLETISREGAKAAIGNGFDLGLSTSQRTLEHVRQSTTSKFINAVMDNPTISRRIDPREIEGGILPGRGRYAKRPVWEDAAKWSEKKRELLEGQPDMDVFEWTKPKWDPKKQIFDGEEIIGAAIMPKQIVNRITKTEAIFRSPEAMTGFLKWNNKFLSVWRGLATMTPGFHSRNGSGVGFINWTEGVGSDLAGIGKGKMPVPGENFLLRHLQGLKLTMLNSQTGHMGKLPPGMQQAMKKLGYDSLDVIPMPKIAWPAGHPLAGKIMEDKHIVRMGNQHGVAQHASKLDDVPKGNAEKLLNYFEEGGQKTPKGIVKRSLAKVEKATEWNRDLGRTIDNSGRWTLWLDRLSKGDGFVAAKDATVRAHYDYSRLTPFERTKMRAFVPFYSWTRFNTPRMIQAMVENPAKFASVPKLQRELEVYGKDNGVHLREELRPDYFDEVISMQTPFLSNNQPVFAQPDLPVSALGQLNVKDQVSGLHPLLKLGLESAGFGGGQNLFTGAPVEAFPGQESPTLPLISKNLEHGLSAFVPTVGYISRAVKSVQQGAGTEFALSEITGTKFRKLDVRRFVRGKKYQEQKLSRQYMQRLKQHMGLDE